MPRQLSFDLPVITAHGRDDFFVSAANAAAVAMIEGWADWPARKLALVGPAGSGKTHLVHVWSGLSGARIVRATDLPDQDIAELATGPVAVEDCCAIAGQRDLEEALFHLHNLCLAEGYSLLLTARTAPNYWPLSLPDLASRVQATPTVTLHPPDDALLSAVLMKLFHDRQISPTPDLVPFLTRRIDRSFEAAHDIVSALDAAALDAGRAINRTLARELLDKRTEDGQTPSSSCNTGHG